MATPAGHCRNCGEVTAWKDCTGNVDGVQHVCLAFDKCKLCGTTRKDHKNLERDRRRGFHAFSEPYKAEAPFDMMAELKQRLAEPATEKAGEGGGRGGEMSMYVDENQCADKSGSLGPQVPRVVGTCSVCGRSESGDCRHGWRGAAIREHISTPCPSCGLKCLFIGTGGGLTCGSLQCKSPSVEATLDAEALSSDALKAEAEKAKLEREDALSYAREVALGITHHGGCLGLADKTDVPCVRCRLEAAEQRADEMRAALEKMLTACELDAKGSPAYRYCYPMMRREEVESIRALLARSGAKG